MTPAAFREERGKTRIREQSGGCWGGGEGFLQRGGDREGWRPDFLMALIGTGDWVWTVSGGR